MNSPITGHPLPAIGDILLLVSKNKLRKPNTAYQALARRKVATYSHVAIVFSPYSIIDATPTNGVSIRRWDAISKQYDVKRSIVARNLQLTSNQNMQEQLLARMRYYYAQPYSLISLIRRNRKFRDREGLVCSQFVATIFDEVGVSSSDTSPRKTLPIDIDVQTRKPETWSRFSLSGYRLGNFSIESDSVMAQLHSSLSSLDNCFANSTINHITISKLGILLNMYAQLVLNELGSGRITDDEMARLRCISDRDDFRISADELITGWRMSFVEPERQPLFLHEESFEHWGTKKSYIRCCEQLLTYVEKTSPQQDQMIDDGMDKARRICTLLSDRINNGMEYADVFPVLIEVHQYLSQAIELKDGVFADTAPEDIARRIKGYPALMMELQNNPGTDVDNALQCLKAIWFFDVAHMQWLDVRPVVLIFLQQVNSLIALANQS